MALEREAAAAVAAAVALETMPSVAAAEAAVVPAVALEPVERQAIPVVALSQYSSITPRRLRFSMSQRRSPRGAKVVPVALVVLVRMEGKVALVTPRAVMAVEAMAVEVVKEAMVARAPVEPVETAHAS